MSRENNCNSDGSKKMLRNLAYARFTDMHEGYKQELDEEAGFYRRPSDGSVSDEEDDVSKASETSHESEVVDEQPDGKAGSHKRKGKFSDTVNVDDDKTLQPAEKKWKPDHQSKGAALLAKMGYGGGGLGKSGQGKVEPVALSKQSGRTGLGYQSNQKFDRDLDAVWDPSTEVKSVEETVLWLSATDDIRSKVLEDLTSDWIIVGDRKMTIDDESQYCDADLIREMLDAKSVFDKLNERDLRSARTRANPFETIGSAFFQNRAAMKMANMDRVFDWLLTKENVKSIEVKNPTAIVEKDGRSKLAREGRNTDRSRSLFYFADVCAGPGGFTEYVLWRKGFYNTKGFGMTLKGKDDFKLNRFTAASPVFFEPYYGTHRDGDVTKSENIISFQKLVHAGTNNLGVDLLMADGGFSVENQENIQEILSKRIYLCQFLVALSILKTATSTNAGGVFVCKLFDILTPFSVGLVYLMYLVFERVSIHKPHTSRPANSERYIICDSPSRQYAEKVREYMMKINDQLQQLSDDKARDVREVLPAEIIHSDKVFMDYLIENNERSTKREVTYLKKYLSFVKNPSQLDTDQGRLRDQCLHYWKIPNMMRDRNQNNFESLNDSISRLIKIFDFDDLHRRPPKFTESVLHSDNDKRIRFSELRMCALSEKTLPLLLFSVKNGVYFHSQDSRSGFERLSVDTNFPLNTVLYVQVTKTYHTLSAKGKLENAQAAIRILDAAVINGDDISSLPFDDRMAAARKMCEAIRIVNQSDKQVAHAFTAKVFKLDELGEQMENFHTLRVNGEEVAVISESESQYCICRGIRVVSLLADTWVMCWSNREQKPYAFDKSNRSHPVYSDQFEQSLCCMNFWKAIVTKKGADSSNEQANISISQWHWDWTCNLDARNDYGPRQILEDDQHPSGPTWKSISQIARRQKEKCILSG